MNRLLFLTILLQLMVVSSASSQFQWLNPKPSGLAGIDIAFYDDQIGFIINESQLLKTEDGGNTWNETGPMGGNQVKFINGTGFIIGQLGKVYKSTDRGGTWNLLPVNFDYNLNSINVFNDTIYLTSSNRFVRSYNGGKNWHISEMKDIMVTKSVFTDGLTGHAVGKNGKIVKTIDGGTTWYVTESSNVIPSDFFTVFFVNDKVGYASQEHREIYKTIDGGETWKEIKSLDAAYSVYFLDENIGFVGGDDGVMHKTTDGGTTWKWIGYEGRTWANDINSIYFLTPEKGFATGTRGRILRTEDGGTTWTPYSLTYTDLSQIHFPEEEVGYALGDRIYKTYDGGNNWEVVETGLAEESYYYRMAHFPSKDIGYVIARTSYNSDVVVKTTDGGKNWEKLTISIYSVSVTSIYFSDIHTGYVCLAGSMSKTTDGGKTWTNYSTFAGSSLAFINSTTAIALKNGDLYQSDNAGISWTVKYQVDGNLTQIDVVNDKVAYITGEYGLILKTADGGKTWKELKTEYYDLKSLCFYNENIGYVWGEYGSMFVTRNGGLTWERQHCPAGIASAVITKGKTLYVAGTNGAILRKELTLKDLISVWAGPAFNATESKAEIGGVINSSFKVSKIMIELFHDTSFERLINVDFQVDQNFENFSFSKTLEGLLPGTSYRYRIVIYSEGEVIMSNTVPFITNFPLSVDSEDILPITIYPNPGSDYIYINLNENYYSYEVYDVPGKKVASGLINESLVDISKLPPSTYILMIQNKQHHKAIKFIKE